MSQVRRSLKLPLRNFQLASQAECPGPTVGQEVQEQPRRVPAPSTRRRPRAQQPQFNCAIRTSLGTFTSYWEFAE